MATVGYDRRANNLPPSQIISMYLHVSTSLHRNSKGLHPPCYTLYVSVFSLLKGTSSAETPACSFEDVARCPGELSGKNRCRSDLLKDKVGESEGVSPSCLDGRNMETDRAN